MTNHHEAIVTEQELSVLATRCAGLGPAELETERRLQELDRTVCVLVEEVRRNAGVAERRLEHAVIIASGSTKLSRLRRNRW